MMCFLHTSIGTAKYMTLWPHYYTGVQGIIFVVDASDLSNFDEAARVLDGVVSHADLAVGVAVFRWSKEEA